MNNEFKNGIKVIVYGPGETNGKQYKNVSGIVIERDPYYKDYLVKFTNGTEDWFLAKYLRQPYSRRRKGK